jgi:membrane carboxypeptidase/penicillin-binding protein PbpC
LAGRTLRTSEEFNVAEVDETIRIPHLDPVSVLRVEDATGKTWIDWETSYPRPILSPQLAYLMTNVLSDEMARWPSMGHPNSLEIGRPSAAKFGRTTDGKSNWVIGYTPQRVAGVWIGQENPEASQVSPATTRLAEATQGLWHAIMQYASRELPSLDWAVPDGMSTMKVCDPSGMLPTTDCPNVVDEVFLPGNEPIQIDSLYRTLQTNQGSGKLATVFTPLDQVKEHSFFIAPQQAETWTGLSGLEPPPSDYDPIPANIQIWQNAQIISPEMFDAVKGEVEIIGRAAGLNFDYYRIDVGAGLNPETWLQIGEDVHTPVQKGQLAVWDTHGLSGLYAIQLLVVRQDKSLEKATTLVTVDNQGPDIQINYPLDGEVVSAGAGDSIVLQNKVEDDLGLKSVSLYMDGQLLAILTQAPYSISWESTPGSHNLRVQATDLAGNTSEASTEFTVK